MDATTDFRNYRSWTLSMICTDLNKSRMICLQLLLFFSPSWLKTNLCGCFSNFVTVIYNGLTSIEHCGLFNYSSEILKVSLGSKILLQTIGQNKTILHLQIYLEKNPRNNNWGISNCLCSFASQKHLCHLGNCKSSWINYHAAFLEANLHNCYHYAECE